MTSVFDDGEKAATVAQEKSEITLPVQSAAQQNPVIQVRTETSLEIITDQQIDSLGDQSSSQMSAISQSLLSQVRASDAEILGQKLNELIGVAKGLDPTKYKRKGIFSFITNLFGNAKEKILSELQSIDGRMQVLIGELDRSALLHEGRINDLENMYNANVAAHNELENSVKEGERMLGVLNTHLASEQQAADAFAAQRTHDVKERIDRLEKRIDDNKRAMLLAKQAAPEIRLLQSCARDLSNQFKNVKAVTIPAWKNALTLYLIQLEQKKGTFLPFLIFAFGYKAVAYAFIPSLLDLISRHKAQPLRNILKEGMVKRLFRGRTINEIDVMAKAYADWVVKEKLRPEAIAEIACHREKGHTCLMVSASLDIYLGYISENLKFDHLLCTTLETHSGKFTGNLVGINCRGPEKVRRMECLLGTLASYDIYAYGDSDGDKELLALTPKAFYQPFRGSFH